MAEEEHSGHSVDVQECFDKVIKKVSHKWDDLARQLGFDRNEIKGIATTEPSPDHRCREVLDRWRNREGSGATLQVLTQALIDIGERLTTECLEGKKTGNKGKGQGKRKAEQSHEADSSEESPSMGKDPHAGPAPSRMYFPPVAKAVGSCWVKFAVEQLSLTAQDVVNIQLQHPSSTEHQACQALELWRDRRGRKACRVKLAQALRRGGFPHAADELDRYDGQDISTNGLSTEEPVCIPHHNLQWKGHPHKKRKTQDPGGCSVQFKQESKQSNHVPCAETNGMNTMAQATGISGNGIPQPNGSNGKGYETNSTSSWSSQHHQSSSSTSAEEPESDKEASSVRKLPQEDTKVENNTEDKDSIYHAIVTMGEKSFDDKAYINLDEFAKTVQDLETFTAIVIKTEEKKKAKLSVQVKSEIRNRVDDKVAEVGSEIWKRNLFNKDDRSTLHKLVDCFKRFEAALRKAELGCVLCHLDFPDVGCYNTFWQGCRDGSLSDALTRELITDEMRASEGGADLYIHVRVLDSATEDGDFSDQDPSGTSDRGPPHPGPSREQSGQGPPAPGSSNHGDVTPPGYHGDGTGGQQVSGGDYVIQVKQEPAEQVSSCCMMGTVKSEIDNVGMEVKEESELDRQFAAIADRLGSMWERLASSLGFNTDYIRDLTARLPPSLRPHQLICDWMERNLGDVTLEQLVQALRDAGIHEVADAAASGQLFVTGEYCGAAKEKPDDDRDVNSPGQKSSPAKWDGYKSSSSSGSSSSESVEESDDRSTERDDDDVMPSERDLPDSTSSDSSEEDEHLVPEGKTFSDASVSSTTAVYGSSGEEEEETEFEFDRASHSSNVNLQMYPTGEDALAWNDCIQDFFKTDEDTTTSIQQTWPSNLLVKHLIRDRFFHSYLCEYWKQYQSFPGTLTAFVEFVTKMSVKHLCNENEVNDEHFKSVYENICIVVGKATFENHTNHNSMYVYKGQLELGDIQQLGSGWLKPVDSNEAGDAFQFVHDSIRQYLMAVWVAHTVRTQTDCTELLRVCAEKSAHLPITCYSFAHLLGMADLPPTHLSQFITLLMQPRKGVEKFNHLLSVVTTITESKQSDALSTLIQTLFPGQTLDLSALPEISHHGLHCLTQLIKSTTLIQTIRLPDNISFITVLKQYPFERKPVSNVDHANQLKYLSYLPLFECMPRTSRYKDSVVKECRFAQTDKYIDDCIIHRYLQFAPSLQNITVRSGSFLIGTLGNLAKSLLFTPNVTNLAIAVKRTSSEDVVKAMNILSCLHKLENVEFTECWCTDKCVLSVVFATFALQCKTPCDTWPGILSFRPFDIKRLTVQGRYPTGSMRRVNGIPDMAAENLVSYFQSLQSLVELKFNCLHNTSTSTWSMLFQGLASLPTENTEAGKFPPLELLCCTNCELTCQDIKPLFGQLQTFQNLTEIDLSHNKITDEAVPGLAEGFGSCQNLKHARLTNNKLTNKGALLLLLQDQCKCMQVDTTGNNISGELVYLLSDRENASQSVEEIDLSHCDLTDEAVPALVQILGTCQNLKKVNLSDNRLSDKGDFLILSPLPNLEEIDLSHNAISDEAVNCLAEGLGSYQKIRKVNLSHNMLSDRGDFLPPLPNLEEIDLSHNAISDEAVPGLAQGLGSCQKLKRVDLSDNNLSDRGDFLPPLPNLEGIDLSCNAISNEAVPGLAEGFALCQSLKKVDLSYNKLSFVGELTAVFINLPKLTRVDIANNSLSDESLPTIAAWLKVCTCVERVDLYGNNFSAEGVRDFVRNMKGKAYRWSCDDLLYDGSQADVGEGVGSGGEDVRREEQQWERLRKEKDEIRVKVGELTVYIQHEGPRANNVQ